MTDYPIATITVTDVGNGADVAVTGNDGSGDINTKDALNVLCRAISTVIVERWHEQDWDDASRTVNDVINAYIDEKRTRVADTFKHAGLLAPDLPEPDECPKAIHKPGWFLNLLCVEYAGVCAGRVWLTDAYGWGKSRTPDEIRAVAHKLLAAANAAEEGTE